MRVEDIHLIDQARSVLRPRRLSTTVEVGSVGCALVTETGAVHLGVCIDAACGIGFCAEHAAIASMITHGESRIATIVAARQGGEVLPPCGRCRELICQIDPGNVATRVIVSSHSVTTLRQLLPRHWLVDGAMLAAADDRP